MILDAARAAFARLFTPEFRGVFWKSLGITVLALVALWLLLERLFAAFALPWLDALLPGLPAWAGWLGVVAAIVAGIGLAVALAFLVAPVTAMVAGLFLDDVAAVVEREDFPGDPPGRPLPLAQGLWLSLRFFGVVLLGNLVALLLLLVPGVNIAAFFLVNAYLLSREFFEFAAMRLPQRGRREGATAQACARPSSLPDWSSPCSWRCRCSTF